MICGPNKKTELTAVVGELGASFLSLPLFTRFLFTLIRRLN
jgi:hypothetical protein